MNEGGTATGATAAAAPSNAASAAPSAGAPAPVPVPAPAPERASHEVLQAMLDGLPGGACLVVNGRVTAANERLALLLNRSLEELRSTPDICAFLPPEDRERFLQDFEARLRGKPVPEEYSFSGLREDGTHITARVRIAPFPLAGPEATLFLSLRDRDRERSGQLIRGLVDASIAVQTERTPAGIFRIARERLEALGLSVAFTENAGGQFRFLAADGVFARAADALRERYPDWIPLDAFVLADSAARNPQGLFIEDVPALLGQLLGKPRSEVGVDPGLRAVAAGLSVDGVVAFTLAGCATNFDATVASAFGLFAKQLGAAIETTRRLDDLARSNRELMTVNHVARASATLASGLALTEAIERLALSVAIDAIALFRREDDQLVLAVQQGFPEGWVADATRVPVGQGSPWGDAAASGEPVVFDMEDGRDWHSLRRLPTPPGGLPTLFSAERSAPESIADSIAVPLQISDEVNGVLVASRPGLPLTRDDLRLLTTVAAQLAVSLQNALLFDQTQRRISELSLLLELGQAVSGSLDTQEVLKAGARVAVRALRCSAAWVLLPDAALTELRSAAAEDPLLGDRTPMHVPLDLHSLSALAFHSGKEQVSSDAMMDPRVDRELSAIFGCRATLAVPLLSHDRSLGVLLLIERSGDRVFRPQDIRLASHAAQLLAASVSNADLFSRERQRAQEMALLNEVSRTLAGSLELKPLLDVAAETLAKLLDAPGCFILLWDQQAKGLRCHAAPPQYRSLMATLVVHEGERSLALDALRKKGALQISAGGERKLVDGHLARAIGHRSELAVPMLARDQSLGAILIVDSRSRVFTDAEVERATAVAGQVALAVLSARLYEDLRESYMELARAQNELIDRERLAALGELSASIAHEVRNPLGVIFNSLHGLKRLLRPAGEVKLLLDIVGEESERLDRMVGDLLDYSRPLQPALSPVNVKSLVQDALAAARPREAQESAGGVPAPLPDSPELKLNIPDDLYVRADARLLRQALINLFLNAFQAMSRGPGVLRVSAVRAGGEATPVKGGPPPGPPGGARPQARIVISDTGPGIPADVRDRVFQPFFTTKATGTGLGLAVVKRIVDGHGGSIVIAEKGRGAEFHLTLPLEPAP
jgi:signal transduction histidine kinase